MTHERCETCRFWEGRISGRVYEPGPCHRYPPTVLYNHNIPRVQARWPNMTPQDWCGEWQEKRNDA